LEKKLSLNYEEAAALLEMCLFTYLNKESDASDSALRKLGDLCKELMVNEKPIDRLPVSRELACVGRF